MKKQLSLLILYIPFLSMAQILTEKNAHGIQWTNGLSWAQIKQKAQQENKYIFIDAYATWCGPCKKMDRIVYTNDTVGLFFNDKFISVKVQMDESNNDNNYIKSWYADAHAFLKHYRIEGYPSFIFLDPNANLVHKEMGCRNVEEFLAIAKTAIQPGKVYEDKYADYDRLLAEYRKGIKDYDKMPYMISTAYKFDDDSIGKQLLEEHTAYVKKLKPEKRYTKENIQVWSGFILNSNSPRFEFFYRDGKIIDKVMNQKGYAWAIVDRTVRHEITDSFFRMQQGETTLITGDRVKNKQIMSLGNLPVRTDGKIISDNVEADWKMLYQMIRQKFNRNIAKRNVLAARIDWYKQHSNYTTAVKYTLLYYKKYPPILDSSNAYTFNDFGWKVFCYVPASEKKIIASTLQWIKAAVEFAPAYTPMLDTYANLLYKTGRKDQAIRFEEKAVNIAEQENAARIVKGLSPLVGGSAPEKYRQVAEQMKKGEKTYIKEGALWN